MSKVIEGIVAPVLTPFDSEGKLQSKNVEDSVGYTLKCGCHAVVAAGTGVQETAALTIDERKMLITKTIDAVDGDVPVLVGVSHPAQPVVADLIDHAEYSSADAILAMPPWGAPPTPDEIFEYYKMIGEETALPILVYNNPSVTVDMSWKTISRVSKLDSVRYVKESSRDWQKIGRLFESVHDTGNADLFTTMDVLLPTLQAGGVGAIVPPPASVPCMSIYEAYNNGAHERADSIQRTFHNFPPKDVTTGLTGVIKAAAEIANVPVGPPRKPYSSVSDGTETLEEWMTKLSIPRWSE